MSTTEIGTEPSEDAVTKSKIPKPPSAASSARRRRLVAVLQGQGLVIMLALIVLFFTTRSETFFTWSNALVIGGSSAALGIMALGQTFLIVSGGIDVSVGSVVAVSTVVTGILFSYGWSFWPVVAVAIFAGAVVGAVNAFIVIVMGVNPFIATLGTMSLFAGLAFTIASGETRVVNDETLAFLGIGRIGGIPVTLILFLILLAIAIFVERFTAAGRTIYAIGGNPEAARLSGLRVRMAHAILYLLSGVSGGIAGVVITAQLAAASPQIGGTFLLSVITAVILGGASLSGGRGSVLGTAIAVAILGTLANGFAQLSWSSSAQDIVLGLALIVAVLLDQTSSRIRGASVG